jgi:serine/threonine protein kinase
MEFIDGIGADALVAQHGPLPVADACEIARQAARGLAYIQQHGMVHRDIKPSNLMLTVVRADEFGSGGGSPNEPGDEQAVVKILDLGLALLVGDDQQRLTLMDNRAMGTAMYMSPEQWRTTSVDIRADIYSLGCSLSPKWSNTSAACTVSMARTSTPAGRTSFAACKWMKFATRSAPRCRPA